MSPRAVLVGLATLVAAVAPAAAVAAPFAPGAVVLSASQARLEQADDVTTQVALSRDARYAIIVTRATNLFADDDPDPPGRSRIGGIFRRTIATGDLELVADGDLVDERTRELVRRGARSASVSDDGRFVAFATNQQLVAADTNDNADVYVRDMDRPVRAPDAFVLASAKDGGDVPASYAPRSPALPGRNPGSEVFAGSAISGDGRSVVFRTGELASDLPDRASVDLPPDQLLVRDLRERRTRLVTRALSGGPAGGVAGPSVISADGSTVAWVGFNAPAQTRFIAGEQADPQAPFYLWQRVADGPDAPTRRITGLADPDDPACGPGETVTSDPTALGPCFGPLSDTEQGRSDITTRVPSLSADGRTVAFLASAGARPASVNTPGLDLYVTSMAPGASRKAATVELTREGQPDDGAQSSPMESATITADGRGVFLVTSRIRFVLPVLGTIGVVRQVAGTRDLYYVDLERRTIERAVTGAGGADPSADVQSNPSPSADGRSVAFISGASNLFFGDGNQRADAFLAVRPADVPAEAPAADPESAPLVVTQQEEPSGPTLDATVTSLRDGRLRVRARAPFAGTLTVFARAGRPLRTVARTTRRATRPGRLDVRLRLTARDRARLRRTRRLSATVRLRYVPAEAGVRALTDVADGIFRLPRRPANASRTNRGAGS
ncbi:hypothetical protein GKE82_06840 [Conexibacter sp. W3-3-2]|uniref:hypothetical protein n=1 Tax=Conexibacter sp. W3-3-2 TaxID=2675227 RepID=UPI0012B6F185|nr:hypothetical protein [Conexibacter sp. W3-3-2]MTD44025.1 hypothetical protein [Conexibacter sp. W3-3-2]